MFKDLDKTDWFFAIATVVVGVLLTLWFFTRPVTPTYETIIPPNTSTISQQEIINGIGEIFNDAQDIKFNVDLSGTNQTLKADIWILRTDGSTLTGKLELIGTEATSINNDGD